MCEQCETSAKVYLQPIEGWGLFQATKDGILMEAGDWGLTNSDNPKFIWKPTPTGAAGARPGSGAVCDNPKFIWKPTPRAESEDGAVAGQAVFFDAVYKFENSVKKANVDPLDYWDLVETCRKSGFDFQGNLSFSEWLFDHFGKWVKEKTPIDQKNHNIFYVHENAEKFGYVSKQKNRKVGQIYTTTNEFCSALPNRSRRSCLIVEPPFVFPFGEKVLLTEKNGSEVKILFGQKVYTTYDFLLSPEPVMEK